MIAIGRNIRGGAGSIGNITSEVSPETAKKMPVQFSERALMCTLEEMEEADRQYQMWLDAMDKLAKVRRDREMAAVKD